jgi:hypothetical protein
MLLRTKPKIKKAGLVYCLKGGDVFKIGVTVSLPRRLSQLAPQCPYRLDCAHVIRTDDMYAVENYWHRQFARKRLNGEWFALEPKDIQEFSKWRVATLAKTGRLEPLDQTVLTLLKEVEANTKHAAQTAATQTKRQGNKTMPQVQSSEFTLADKGVYIATLCEIETKSSKQRGSNGEEKDSTFWVWKFKGCKEKGADKKVCKVEITTGTGVTKKDSALKSLLSSAFPDMSPDEMRAYNTDEMIDQNWRIKVGMGEKPDGSPKNVILDIEAYDREFDAFADEQ